MSEKEAAELFNRELDVLLRDGRPPFPSHDERLMAAASSIAAADFSGDSLVRADLRGRLTGKGAAGRVLALVAEALNAAAFKVVFAGACLLLIVTQVARQPAHRPAAPAIQAAAPRPAAPPRPVRPAAPAVRPAASPAPGPVFASIPMAAPRGEPLSAFPIGSAGAGSPIVTAAVREVEAEGGVDLVMETDSAVLIIERRATSYEEFFEKRTI